MRLHLNKTLRAALIAAFVTTAAQAAVTSYDITTWQSYDDQKGAAVVGHGTAQVMDYTSYAQQFNTDWNFIVTVNADSITADKPLTLMALYMTQSTQTGPVGGLAEGVTLANASGTTKATLTSWSNAAAGGAKTLDLTNVNDLTFVMSHASGGNLTMNVYADGDFTKSIASATQTGQKFSSTTVDYVAFGGKGGMEKLVNTNNKVSFPNDADTGTIEITKAGYLLGSVITTSDLNKYYTPPTTLLWNSKDSATWDLNTTNWVAEGDPTPTTFKNDMKAEFGTAGDLVKDITVSGTISADTASVNDNYKFTVASGSSLNIGTLSVAAEKTATVAGENPISLGALSGAGKLALGENTQVSLGAISGTNTFSLADGSVLELAFSGLPATITAEGTGAIRLLKGADQNTTLTTITAPILKLAADSSHNSRFVYNNSSNLSGVQNLYFDGAQLWLNSGTSALNFAGTVTFGTENHYSESAQLDSAMRVNSSAKFSGAVDVQKNAKITWQAGNQSVEFAGAVTGSGNLTLATYNNGAQNGSKFIIGGDASQFAGALNINHASISLEIKEGAKLNIGSGSDLKGAVSLNGELSVNGNAAISGNITGTGSITKNGDGTLVLSGAGNVLSHTIVVNAGYMTLSGGFEIGGIAPTGGETIYEGGRSDKNGYETATGNVVVYSGEGVDTTGGSFTYHGESVTLNNGAYTLRGEKDTTTFYINEGTESYSWIDEHKTEDFSNIVVKQAGTLLVNKDINMSLVSADSRGAVEIDSGYAATAAAGRNVTLTGAGTYVLEQSCVQGNQIVLPGTLGAGWTGTVQIHDVTTSATTQNDFTPLAKDGSTIELKGFNGLTNKWVGDQTENFKLTNSDDRGYAWYFSGATSSEGYTATFSGTWSGDGTMQTASNNLNFKFSGNISDWDGKFQVASGAPDLTFSGNATEVNAVIDRNGKTLHLFVGDGSEFSTTFKADVTASSLTVSDLAAATFEADATFGSLSGTGKVAVNEGATLTVSGTVGSDVQIDAANGATIDAEIDSTQVGIAADATATFAQGIQDASGVEFLGEEGVQVKNTNGPVGGSAINYSVAETAAKVTADVLFATNTEAVVVNNALIEVGSIIHMGTEALTLTKVDGETLTAVSTSTAEVIIQNAPTATLADMTIGAGGTVAVYQGTDAVSSQEGTVTITETLTAGGGTLLANLVLAGSSTLDLHTGEGAMAALTLGSNLAFVDGGLVILDATTLAKLDGLVMGTEGNYLELVHAATGTTLAYGEDGTADYNGMWFGQLFDRPDTLIGDFKVVANGTSFGLTKVSNVPEPTTGTLSLLALMALAARRRRK